MMKKTDPNEEVERWKDALYEKIKYLSKEELTEYLENNANRVLRKYGIPKRQHIVRRNDVMS